MGFPTKITLPGMWEILASSLVGVFHGLLQGADLSVTVNACPLPAFW